MKRFEFTQKGVVVPIAAMLVVVLLVFTGILILSGHQTLVRNELQAAADSAAHAAATTLCSTKLCWQQARAAAAEATKRHSAHRNSGSSALLEFEFESTDDIDGFGDNLVVTIERGRWTPLSGFESFEGWETRFPGLMGFVAASAVRVTITATDIAPVALSFFGNISTVSASSVAAADPVSAAESAPFAIPVCALVGNDGDYRPETICTAERLFTKVSRHCSGSSNCGVLPYFPIEPLHSNGRQMGLVTPGGRILFVDDPATWECPASVRGPGPGSGGPVSFDVPPDDDVCQYFLDDRYADFDLPRFEDAFDHYGVVGLPGRSVSNENDVRSVIGSTSGTVAATLGDPFYILDSGLTEAASKSALWDQIVGRGLPDSTGRHPRYQDTELKQVMHHFVYPVSSGTPPPPINGPGNGRCNSERYSTGHASSDGKFIKKMMETPVWKVAVPIIADRNGPTCRNDGTQTAETTVAGGSERPWEIIGFVNIFMHDLDIGAAPETYDVLGPMKYDHALHRAWSGNSFPPTRPFIDPNCNLVRGKIECGADLIPRTDSSAKRKTVFVH